jgi:ParB family chromosome partitioning protein
MSFDAASIEELAQSIAAHGVLQPIILRKSDFGYELVAGERRWRAARKAGLKTVPSIIRTLSEEENAMIALIENVQRENLNIAEEATAFATIIETYRLTQDELAKAVGKSRPHVTNTLRILKLPPQIVGFVRDGKLTAGHANALGALKNERLQLEAAERIIKRGLSVREAEKLCSKENNPAGTKKKQKPKSVRKSADILAVEEELTHAVGTKVVIVPEKKGGRIELHYYNRDGLDDLIDLLRNHA